MLFRILRISHKILKISYEILKTSYEILNLGATCCMNYVKGLPVGGFNFSTRSFYIGLFKNFKLHRIDGPAYVEYYINFLEYVNPIEQEQIKLKGWYQHGMRHRTDGPAIIEYDEQKNITNKEYYLLDKQLTKYQYYRILFLLSYKITAIKNNKRQEIFRVLEKNGLTSKIGGDMCNEITHYVY